MGDLLKEFTIVHQEIEEDTGRTTDRSNSEFKVRIVPV
jgi:hypothetical protein